MSDLPSFLAQFATPYDPATDTYRRPPYAAPVKAGKATAIYNAHSYHTKVPPQGIEPYIQHYTNASDLVLDPFCGSGMTGVAALKLGRRVILNDLSPAAAHIAYNYCTPVDVDALKREFARIKAAVKEEFDWLYGTTCDRCGGDATIEFMAWSDVFECDRCGSEIILYEVAFDKETGKLDSNFSCPNCSKVQQKKGLRWVRTIPVRTNYTCASCGRVERATTNAEKNKIADIENLSIPYWYPTNLFDPDGEQYRLDALRLRQIFSVKDFYTHRSMWALARLWHEFNQVKEESLRNKLRFLFTSFSSRAAKKAEYRIAGGAGNIARLSVPSLQRESNVLELAERKATAVFSGLAEIENSISPTHVFVNVGSATYLSSIPDSTVDYIFTDPPFGKNIFYSDLNFLWEVWLGQLTNPKSEAIINRAKRIDRKTINDYYDLMAQAFREMERVLKPSRWASVVFHNSDDAIWQVILKAAESAGLELTEVNIFDKEQLSFKGTKGAKGIERVTNKDIVLNLRKPSANRPNNANAPTAAKNGDAESRIVQRLAEFLATKPNPNERTLQHFWNVVLHDMLTQGVVDVSMEQVGALLPYYFKQADNKWYLRGEAVLGGDVFNLKTDAGALAWLTAVLNEPQTLGDLIPKFQIAAAQSDSDAGRLETLLEQNFWQDKKTGRWRLPTDDERAKLTQVQDIADAAHLRVIDKYLNGESDHRPTQWQLVEWLRFAYRREAFKQVVGLAKQIDEAQVDETFRKEYKKIVAVSRMRVKDEG